MDKVVGIRFRKGGKIYHFDPGDLIVKKGDFVMVRTEQGVGFGEISEGPYPRDSRVHPVEIKKIERLAEKEEIQKHYENLEFEKEAKAFCLERIASHNLVMNLVDVEYL